MTLETDHFAARPLLTVVTPTYNCASSIARLVHHVFELSQVEMIIIDDASTDETPAILNKLEEQYPTLRTIRLVQNEGAGNARNHALGDINGKYVLFFDADDVIIPNAVQYGIEQLEKTNADVAMFSYEYHRGDTYTGMNNSDARIWRQYLQGNASYLAQADKFPALLRFTNYPWNKIMRWDHYKNTQFKFGSTIVHNDIEAHWRCLLRARSVLLLDVAICHHIVHPSGQNLTNNRSRKRLALFEALGEIFALTHAEYPARSPQRMAFWEFCVETAIWGRNRIDNDFATEFDHRAHELLEKINLEDYALLRTEAPNVAKFIRTNLSRLTTRT